MNLTMNKNDEIVMKLIHYFITEHGYNPVVLHGAKDEIWLENTDSDYKIVRIVTNYIHNDEQLDFDIFRTKQITKKIKRKTFSLKMNVLSIFTNLGDNVHLDKMSYKEIDCIELKDVKDIKKYKFVTDMFPDITSIVKYKEEGLELFMKLTEDINRKNKEETSKAEDIFKKKRPIITYGIILSNIIVFLGIMLSGTSLFQVDATTLYNFGGLVNYDSMSNNSELIRIVTSLFVHGGLIHLLLNLYSLYLIGPQLESFFGKTKFLLIYLGSGIVGNLFSMLFQGDYVVSVGASGAIFGLLGALLYFGYHYRVYLSGVIKSQIIPLIILNLFIGFSLSGINNVAHIGGLLGGYLTAKAVGVKYKSTTLDIVNGIIMLTILLVFLGYMVIFN